MATLHQLQQGLFAAKDSGDTDRQKKISDAIRQHPTFQKQSQEKLSKGFKALDGDKRKAAIHKHTARSLGIHENDLDSERGMGGVGRLQFKAQPTAEDKLNFLEKAYGRENLNVANIGGKDEFLYRDESETGGKWRRVDEEGVSLADFTTDVAVFAPEIGGAIAGAVKGAAIGTGVAPGVGTLAGGVVGAAVGGFTAGTAQDVAVRAASGEDIQLGEIAGRRGQEALYGAGFDVATLGAGKFIGKPLMKAVGKTETAQGIMNSFSRLRRAGGSLEEIPQASKGSEALKKHTDRVGMTGGAATRRSQSNIDELGRMEQVLSGKMPAQTKSEAIEAMQARYREVYRNDAAVVKGVDDGVRDLYRAKEAAKLDSLKSQLDAEQAGIRLSEGFDVEDAATRARGVLQSQRDLISKESTKRFSEGLSAMDDVFIPSSTLQNKLGGSVRKLSGIMDDGDIIAPLSASQATTLGRGVTALDDMVEKGATIPFRELHNLKKSLDSKAGWSSSAPSDNQIIAREAAGKVRKLLEDTAENFNKKGAKYTEANTYFQDNILPFRDRGLVEILESGVSKGSFKLTPTEVAAKMTKDPQWVRHALANAGESSGALKKELSDIYLNSVGRKLGDINTRTGVAKVLFDDDRLDAIRRLQALQSKLGVSSAKIDAMKIDDVFNRLSGQARKDAEKLVAAKIKAEARMQRLAKQSGFVQRVAKGKIPVPSDPRSFADTLMKHSDPEDIRLFMDRVMREDPIAYQDIRQGISADFKDAIKFGKDGAQRTSLNAGDVSLWKPGAVSSELSGRQGLKYKNAMGEDWVQNWKDLDNALSASAITGEKITEQLRAVFTTGSGLLVVAAGVPKWVYSRAMNAVSGSKLLRPFIRNVESDPNVVKDLIPYLIGTAEGLQALTLEAEDDPEFAEWLDAEIARAGQEANPQEQ